MTNLNTQRQRIVEVNLYNSEMINFDSGSIYWVPGPEEWLLIKKTEGVKDWSFGQLDKLVELIPDEEIQSYYAEIAWQFDDDAECNPADFPGMTPEELKLYEVAE